MIWLRLGLQRSRAGVFTQPSQSKRPRPRTYMGQLDHFEETRWNLPATCAASVEGPYHPPSTPVGESRPSSGTQARNHEGLPHPCPNFYQQPARPPRQNHKPVYPMHPTRGYPVAPLHHSSHPIGDHHQPARTEHHTPSTLPKQKVDRLL